MRPAPPVSVRCNGGPAWRWARVALAALVGAVLALWAAEHAALSAPVVAAFAVGAGASCGALGWWLAAPSGLELRWTGQKWLAGGVAGRLDVMLDLGGWLLLRLRPEVRAPARWIAVSASEVGSAMHALRVAAYARAPEALPRVRLPDRAPD